MASSQRVRRALRLMLVALGVGVVLAATAWALTTLSAKHGTRLVHYRGTAYVIPAARPDYNDAQAAEIVEVILRDRPPVVAANYQALIDYLNTLEAPGYGSSTGGFGDVTGLGKFTYLTVQLPKKTSHRVMIYRAESAGGGYAYFDDFLLEAEYPPSFRFVSEGDDLLYLDERSHREVKRVRVPGRRFAGFASPESSRAP